MDRMEVLADYRSETDEQVQIVARRRTRTGTKPAPGGLEQEVHFHANSIDVLVNGHLVESIPLRHDLSHLSRRDARNLLEEINALKDSRAEADEVIGELHTLFG
ncbi:MAG: hypothetical protein ACK4PI_07745 [Tepidisphaerales bacterium]